MKKLAKSKVSGTVLLGVMFIAAGCGSKEEDSLPNYVVNKVQTGTTAGESQMDGKAAESSEAKATPTGVLSIIQEDIAGETGKETADGQSADEIGSAGAQENAEKPEDFKKPLESPDETGNDGTADDAGDELYVTGAADSLEDSTGVLQEVEADGIAGNSEPAAAASIDEIRLLTAGTAVDISTFSSEQTAACFMFEEVPDAVFEQMKGNSYKEDCTVPLSQLRYVRVLHYGFDGVVHVGELIVNQSIAQDIQNIFLDLFEAQYPIEKILLIDTYGGDDRLSMADNNTSAFNYRLVEGTSSLSKHALGLAVDVNPLYNPYIPERDGVPAVLPENAAPYADRQISCEYYIRHGDLCYEAFVSRGFTWGGDWAAGKDYQHFSKTAE